ncbi:dihydroneopterin aldolase [Planomonospora sp. ID82291]|uniref:dihydroneopterin aldolase n=1 Tax=Planomonospora sp. ID82291 TaxID=2738136 RepID=UPI0018C35E1C|nr:dihydroneopterin aldolase [Planomonospora sp. ID82291]MBG0818464.1 dihydroneopterin aldolase [Planomonospora sp. ID82291]
MDQIEIDGLRLRCVIGVKDEERRDKSDVVVDLRIGADVRPAGLTDNLADGWDYRAAAKGVISAVESSRFRTVEALAEAIARTIVVGYKAPHVRVRLHKPGALRFADSVGVVIHRTGDDFTAERKIA